MKVFVAGATGAMGSRLVPQLVARGHEVVGMTRSPEKVGKLRAMGAEPVIADALDREAVLGALQTAKPDAVVHQLTALSNLKNFKKFDEEFALTNRLRTEATDYLIEAAQRSGARRFVAQSYAGWNYGFAGDALKTEEDPVETNPLPNQRESLAAIQHLERVTLTSPGIEGIVLRYAGFYGPGTSLGDGGDIVAMVRKRGMPVVGDGAGVWSFVHIDDAAAATVLALEKGAPGVYNIADDDPAPVSEWLPELAKAVGAKPPRRLPVWLARWFIGDVGVAMMTQLRGISNAKAKRELGWKLRYPSWRQGFLLGLGEERPASRAA